MFDCARDGATVSHNRETAMEPLRRVSGLANERDMRKHVLSLNSDVIGSDVISTQSISHRSRQKSRG